MSTSDLLSTSLNWPGKGLYGIKSSVLQTSESDLVKQIIVSDHMRNHYRRLHGAKSTVDTKPPKAMILGQKSRDRARKEMAQLAYTQNVLDQFSGGSLQNTPRARSTQSARSRRIIQSQPTTYRARSRSIESARMVTRSLNTNGNMKQTDPNDGDIASKLFGDGVLSQALTSMAILGKFTSTARNKSSADVLDKHPDSFSQPDPTGHQPRLLKRDGKSALRDNRTHYNPPTKTKPRPTSATKQKPKEILPDENKQKEDAQLALREQLNRSLELRHNVEKKIKKAKATTTTTPTPKKQSDEIIKRYGLTEQERLQYIKFMQDITDEIIRKNLTTEPAIEKLFEIHIDKNRATLDERRLRGLLEALKEDLGVQSSRKANTYSAVQKASTFDREPLPPQIPITTREDSLILTPKTPYDENRRSSYDMNTPFSWEKTDNYLDKQLTVTQRVTHESKRNSLNTNTLNPYNDDHLFSTPSTTIEPKPRLSRQIKTEDHHQSDDIPNTITTEHESSIPMNFNTTIRKPIDDLNDVGWFKDSQPEKTTIEKTSLHHIEEEASDNHRPSQSPQLHNHSELNPYDSADFDDNNNDSDN